MSVSLVDFQILFNYWEVCLHPFFQKEQVDTIFVLHMRSYNTNQCTNNYACKSNNCFTQNDHSLIFYYIISLMI